MTEPDDSALQQKSERYEQLDALRGLAALSVVLSHFSLLTPLLWLRRTPLRIFLGGHEAVVLFFVLSGFVLALQFNRNRKIDFGSYVIKRIARIYLPYLFFIFVAVLLYALTYRGDIAGTGDWFNGTWRPGVTFDVMIHHIVFIDNFQSDTLVPVIWSLVYEMRISLLFPIIMFATLSWPIRRVLGISFLLSIAACVFGAAIGRDPVAASGEIDWSMTLHYQLMFVLGALAAINLDKLKLKLQSSKKKMYLVGFGLLLYFSARVVTLSLPIAINVFVFDWLLSCASVMLVVGAVLSSRSKSALENPVIRFLGKISYSVYLCHLLVLFSVVHLLGSYKLSLAILLAGMMILPVSYLAYRYVELPSIRFGRALVKLRLPAT